MIIYVSQAHTAEVDYKPETWKSREKALIAARVWLEGQEDMEETIKYSSVEGCAWYIGDQNLDHPYILIYDTELIEED